MQNIDILNKAPNTKTFLGHPVGLFLLFATEMWERLSYYGMRSIMVLYLAAPATIAAMGWGSLTEDQAQQNALTYWGWFGFFVYIAPVIGGWIADRITGQRLAILIGGLLMAFGKFIMAIPFVIVGNLAYECLLIGMAMNIIGNGLFKPNISTLVSDLYEPNDKRQESAFTIFYMGINVGAFLGIAIMGFVGEKVDYQYAFFLAGIGMLVGVLLQVLFAQNLLGDIGNKPNYYAQIDKQNNTHNALTPIEKDRIKAILMMSLFSVIFWMGFEQASGAFNLIAKNQTDLFILGYEIPASWLQLVNPLFVILLAPFIASFWIKLGNKNPNEPKKFVYSLMLLGVGFMCMIGAATQIGGGAKAHIGWLIGAYFFHTIAELFLSPVGLSVVTKLSPIRYVSFMMGMWFFFSGIGNKLSAELGKFIIDDNTSFMQSFTGVTIFCFIMAFLLWLFSNKIVSWMHKG